MTSTSSKPRRSQRAIRMPTIEGLTGCLHCRKRTYSRNTHYPFCSEECRDAGALYAFRTSHRVSQCEVCRKPYLNTVCSPSRYCSAACHKKLRADAGREEYVCKRCETPYFRAPGSGAGFTYCQYCARFESQKSGIPDNVTGSPWVWDNITPMHADPVAIRRLEAELGFR